MPTTPITTHALLLLSLPRLTRGDIVTYHGSLTEHHGKEFVVMANIDGDIGGGLVLRQRNQQHEILEQVRRVSVTPTGDTVELCKDCNHITEERKADSSICAHPRCPCDGHGPGPAPAISKAAEHLLVAISRAARQLREGVERTGEDVRDGAIEHAGGQALARAASGPQLEALVDLARAYLLHCPELGVTRARLDAALTGNTAAIFTP
ncbi:hypothetical protein [Nocardia wallacei]|uniref:Uncharacterized protein n=1 Tax=Nocardia wallacei TaxID=480035 RepID=A0A7G1KT15_9NOCA|nr:hypothetical protein [Nocardia wallacei]BCK58375.1 hypothetical protein NWFMUON74_61470 [Nocardia wallacei]